MLLLLYADMLTLHVIPFGAVCPKTVRSVPLCRLNVAQFIRVTPYATLQSEHVGYAYGVSRR